MEILSCVQCLSSVCSTSLGLSLPSITGQLLQGTNWDLFPWAFSRSGEQGNTAAFLPYPRPVLPKASHYSCLGQGCSWPPFWQCWHGMHGIGERSSVLCSTPHPISIEKAEPPFLLPWDAASACATGKSCASGSCAPQLATGTSSMWALQVQKHFTLQGVCGGGYSWKGSAGSCSLPAVICQIISLQPAQILLALGLCLVYWESSRGHTGLPGGPSSCPGQHGPSAHSPSRKQQLCRVSFFTTTPVEFCVRLRRGAPCPSPAEGPSHSTQLLC